MDHKAGSGVGKKIVWLIVIVLALAYFCKDLVIKVALQSGVRAITGLTLSVRSVSVNLVGTSVGIKGLQLFNPSQFPDPLMIVMPELFIDADASAYFTDKLLHVESMKIDIQELYVIRNQKGELNLDSLRAIREVRGETPGGAPQPEEKMPEMKIDVLQLKIGKVVYKDYSLGKEPKVVEFNVGIDERFENITDPKQLASLIVTKALMNTTIAALANFDLGPLKGQVGTQLEKAASVLQGYTGKSGDLGKVLEEAAGKLGSSDGAGQSAKDTLNEAADKMKELFPFGKKKQE
ncbi:MAG TPA: hypothetical protein P5287_00715 [bacterium]|nr:hypothetical protein [bacterium]